MNGKRIPWLGVGLALALAVGMAWPVPCSAADAGTASASANAPANAKPAAPPDSPEPPQPSEPPESPAEPEVSSGSTRGHDRVSMGTALHVGPGETVEGEVVCLGCAATVEGKVAGDIVIIGGKLRMSGSGNGDLVGVGSRLVLEKGAKLDGQVVNVGGFLSNDGAEIGGEVQDIGFGGFGGLLPGLPFGGLGGIWGFVLWMKLFVLLVVFIGIILATVLVPERVLRISEESPVHPGQAFLAGLITYIVLAMVQFFLCVTILGIPLAILLYFVFVAVKWIGLAGLFHQVGRRLGKRFGREMSLLGAVLLGFLPFAVLRLIPLCIGWTAWFLLEILAVGYVVLTRVGGRPIGAPAPFAAVTVPPAAPPVAPPSASPLA